MNELADQAGVVFGLAAAVWFWFFVMHRKPSPEEAERERQAQAQIRCPHCGQTGCVTKQLVERKQGISGGKATGALLTVGFSLALTGLSRKQQMSHMKCANCHMEWDVA
jgi:DNA-directed RNA polymerase subunit RPC12/RpoP